MNRNTKCYCGSGLKYKKCHLFKEQGFVKTELGWEKPKKKRVQTIVPIEN